VNITLKIVSSGRRYIWYRREFLSKNTKFKPKIRNKSRTLHLKSNIEKFTVCVFVAS
jgi:hypothetical protein